MAILLIALLSGCIKEASNNGEDALEPEAPLPQVEAGQWLSECTTALEEAQRGWPSQQEDLLDLPVVSGRPCTAWTEGETHVWLLQSPLTATSLHAIGFDTMGWLGHSALSAITTQHLQVGADLPRWNVTGILIENLHPLRTDAPDDTYFAAFPKVVDLGNETVVQAFSISRSGGGNGLFCADDSGNSWVTRGQAIDHRFRADQHRVINMPIDDASEPNCIVGPVGWTGADHDTYAVIARVPFDGGLLVGQENADFEVWQATPEGREVVKTGTTIPIYDMDVHGDAVHVCGGLVTGLHYQDLLTDMEPELVWPKSTSPLEGCYLQATADAVMVISNPQLLNLGLPGRPGDVPVVPIDALDAAGTDGDIHTFLRRDEGWIPVPGPPGPHGPIIAAHGEFYMENGYIRSDGVVVHWFWRLQDGLVPTWELVDEVPGAITAEEARWDLPS